MTVPVAAWCRGRFLAFLLLCLEVAIYQPASCLAQAPDTIGAKQPMPEAPAPLTAAQLAWKTQRLKQWEAVEKLSKTNLPGAISSMLPVWKRDEQEFGPEHPETARTISKLIELLMRNSQSEQAFPLIAKEVQILLNAYGQDDWRVRWAYCQGERYKLLIKVGQATTDRDAQADLLDEKAKLLLKQENYDAAFAAIQQALAIRVPIFGEDSLWVGFDLQILANIHKASFRFEEGEKAAAKAAENIRSWLGPKSPQYSDALCGQAYAAKDHGRFALFEQFAIQALATAESVPECSPIILAQAHVCMGQAFDASNSSARAISQYEKAIAIYARETGETSLDVLFAKRFLARSMLAKGQMEAANGIFDSIEKVVREKYPTETTLLFNISHSRADGLSRAGKLPEAVEAYGRVLAHLQKRKLDRSPRAAEILETQALLEYRQKHLEQANAIITQALDIAISSSGAEQTFRRRIAIYAGDIYIHLMEERIRKHDIAGARGTVEKWLRLSQSVFSPNDDLIVAARLRLEFLDRVAKLEASDLATFRQSFEQSAAGEELLVERKPPDGIKAAELFEKALVGYVALWGPELLCVAETRFNLARAYAEAKQPERAEAEYRRAEPIFLKLYGESTLPIGVANMFMRLSEYCEQRQEYGEALSRARQAQAIYRRFGGDGTELSARARERIGDVLIAMRDYEQAETLFREAIEITVRSHGKQGTRYALLLNNLGDAQFHRTRYADAEKSYLESLSVYQSLPDVGGDVLGMVQENLALAYQKLGKYEPAIEHFRQAIEVATTAKHMGRVARCQANLGVIYGAQKNYAEAESALESAVASLESLGEPQKFALERGRNDLEQIWLDRAAACEARSEFTQAAQVRMKLLAQRKRRFPEETYTVREPALFLALDEKLAKLTPAQLAQYREAVNLLAKARANANFQQALAEVASAAGTFKAIVGEKGSNYASCLEWQAKLEYATGNSAAALATLEQGRALLVELYGDSPMLAANLRTTTQYLQAIGKTPEAIQLQRQIVALYERLIKNVTATKELALARSQLGESLLFVGDLSAASELILDARGILLPFRASAPAYYRENLGHLVLLNLQAGNPQQALPGAQELVTTVREISGDKSIDYAVAADRLSRVQLMAGSLPEAEKLAREVLPIYQKMLGASHLVTALANVNLANVLREKGDLVVAESLYRSAVDVLEANRSVLLARSTRLSLVRLYLESGDISRAKELLKPLEGRQVDASVSSYATVVHLHEGRMSEAAAMAIQNIQLTERTLEASARFLNEQQQIKAMQSFRQSLDRLLSVEPSGRPAAEAYAQLLRWKGAIFSRQNHLRDANATPEGARLLERWGAASGQLATLFLRPPYPHEAALWSDRVSQFTLEKDRTEMALLKLLKSKAVAPPEVARIKASLPANSALIDFVSYQHYRRGPDNKFQFFPAYAAFVVRPDGEVVRVTIPNAIQIDTLVDQWRDAFNWNKLPAAIVAKAKKDLDKLNELFRDSISMQEKAAADLSTLLWKPLAPHLDGVTTVLISPDQSLSKFPFAALPGKVLGTFLIEDMAIAVVPVPQAIPQMVERRSKAKTDSGSLLLMGDIDYTVVSRADSKGTSATPPREVDRARMPFGFTPLAGTGPEVRDIQTRFRQQFPQGKSALLEKSEATEQVFRRAAPRHRWIHLATHGFFAENIVEEVASTVSSSDATSASSISTQHPLLTAPEGLMSGLAFAGANDVNRSYEDDGILCAMEVAAFDLSDVELVVMSACETGLGKTLSGEGVLGLQRAFQVAGARSTISSLWPVSDQAARLSMNRFYRNLWDRKMSKLDALRETQLWMIESARRKKAAPIDGSEATIDSAELPTNWQLPEFWAPFILCGEWN